MANRIFTRSPYWVSLGGVANDTIRVDLIIWNGSTASAVPATVTRSSKPIPSSLVTQCDFNISPFLREYISFAVEPQIYNTLGDTTSLQFCNVVVKTYKNGVLQSSTQYVGLDGYTTYEDDYNNSLQVTFLTEGTYYYYHNANGLISDVNKRPGHLTIDAESTWSVRYTNLVSGAITTVGLGSTMLRNIYRVAPAYWADGNKVEVLNTTNVVQQTYYFRPIQEGKYTVQYLDFINRLGAWQKEFLFKASKESFELKGGNSFLKNQSSVNYDPRIAQRQVMNLNGQLSVKCNTGWVDESFSEVMQQLLLSERILLNGKPVNLKTKAIEKLTHRIDKLINYTIEFEYANDFINTMM